MKNKTIIKLAYSALCMALCMTLPFLSCQIPEIGSMLCLMHIPVLLSGYLCGATWGFAVGLIAPLLRFALFSMPPIFPTGFAMCFELGIYGLVAGFLYEKLPPKNLNIYFSLIIAMLCGRVVWGLVMLALSLGGVVEFSWLAFILASFVNALPGIILHIILIPVIVMALKKAKL